MSDQQNDGRAARAPRKATLPQEELINRRKAKRRHTSHYIKQLASWAIIIVLAAMFTYLERRFRLGSYEPCRFGSQMFGRCMPYHLYVFAPPIISVGIWIWGAVFHYLRKQVWPVALSNAQQTISPRNVTRGYTDLFNLYMRTKRRSYLLGGWGILAFVYVTVCLIQDLGAAVPAYFWVSRIVVVVFGAASIWQGYVLGSRYLPGDVIVRHTLELAIYAISDVTNVEDARSQAERDAEQFVHDNPWWFYPG